MLQIMLLLSNAKTNEEVDDIIRNVKFIGDRLDWLFFNAYVEQVRKRINTVNAEKRKSWQLHEMN